MNRYAKPLQVILVLVAVLALSGCSLGQAASPTATAVDVTAVMTSAAATAFVQLTQIAGQVPATIPASATVVVKQTSGPTATLAAGLQLVTATEGAGGLPAQGTQPAAGTPLVPSLATQPGGAAIPSLTPFAPTKAPGTGTNVDACRNSKFMGDITIPDGTVMAPYQKFTKIWAIQNTGTCAWDQGFGYNIWAGPNMSGQGGKFSGADKPIPPGGVFDVIVEMRAPSQKGDYIAHWMMVDDQGKLFGADFVVYIKVQ